MELGSKLILKLPKKARLESELFNWEPSILASNWEILALELLVILSLIADIIDDKSTAKTPVSPSW